MWEAAKEEEMKIPWKDAKEGSPVPEEQYQGNKLHLVKGAKSAAFVLRQNRPLLDGVSVSPSVPAKNV